jgi:hypothetical protein
MKHGQMIPAVTPNEIDDALDTGSRPVTGAKVWIGGVESVFGHDYRR